MTPADCDECTGDGLVALVGTVPRIVVLTECPTCNGGDLESEDNPHALVEPPICDDDFPASLVALTAEALLAA